MLKEEKKQPYILMWHYCLLNFSPINLILLLEGDFFLYYKAKFLDAKYRVCN